MLYSNTRDAFSAGDGPPVLAEPAPRAGARPERVDLEGAELVMDFRGRGCWSFNSDLLGADKFGSARNDLALTHRSLSTTYSAIARLEVAPGDGALRRARIPLMSSIRKSSTSEPS